MIYAFYNTTDYTNNYFCPDQASIDEGKAIGYKGNFIIGTQSDADALVASCRATWYANNAGLFTVNKDIDPDPIQTTWVVCDLNTEPENTDVNYNIFDVVNGYYNLVTGLSNAKLEQQKTITDAQVWFIFDYESWPTWPPLVKPVSTGTQTL